jgi:hypothetical protein
MTAIRMCIARFDSDTREAFLDLYSKIDAQSLADNTLLTAVDEVPF